MDDPDRFLPGPPLLPHLLNLLRHLLPAVGLPIAHADHQFRPATVQRRLQQITKRTDAGGADDGLHLLRRAPISDLKVRLKAAPLGLADIGDVLHGIGSQRGLLLNLLCRLFQFLQRSLFVREIIQPQRRGFCVLTDEDQQIVDHILPVFRPQGSGGFTFPELAAVRL